eukprot:gene1883-2960_t
MPRPSLTLLAVWPASVVASHCWVPAPPSGFGDGDSEASPLPGIGEPLPPHPRIRLNSTRLEALNKTIQTDAQARSYFLGLRIAGEGMVTIPNVPCGAGADLLGSARSALGLEYTLGLLWRLTGDNRYAKRAVEELIHLVSNCTTWDPFGLNCILPPTSTVTAVLAEMTHTVGIGYDWLYHYLSPDQRSSIIAGTVRLGFKEAL